MPSNAFEFKDSDRNRDNTDTKLDRNMMELSTIEATDTSSTDSHEKTPLMNGENYSLQNRTKKQHRSNSTSHANMIMLTMKSMQCQKYWRLLNS